MSEEIKEPLTGKMAPGFCLPDAKGTMLCLEQFLGKWVVLYFYPRDNTPGCTIEALQFNAALEKFADLGAQVIGISSDTPDSHQKFADKYTLSILLLSDTGHTLKEYGSWKPKTMFVREFLGTSRDTFLIDPNGVVAKIWRKVNPKGHADEVMAALMEKKAAGV